LLYGFSSEKNEDIKLVINNTKNEKVRSCKYLSICIDDELNWHVHIDYIFNMLFKIHQNILQAYSYHMIG